jgi:hypothetical protein
MPLTQSAIRRSHRPFGFNPTEDGFPMPRWEDDDDYGVPPPTIDEEDGRDSSAFEEPKPRTALSRYSEAVLRKSEHAKARPRSEDHKPGVGRKIAAALANFAAGYVNAGGRVRVDPRSMAALNEGLLRPGYGAAMRRWEEEGSGLDAELEGLATQAKLEDAETRRNVDAKRAAAYEGAQKASAAYNARRLEKLNEDPWKPTPSGRKMYQSGSGKIRDLDPPPVSPEETPDQARERRANEVKGTPDLTPEQKQAYVLTGKIPPKPRALRGGQPSRGTPGQFQQVEKDKRVALQNAESAHLKRVKDGIPYADSLSLLESEKRMIMDAYDAGVESLGGSVAPRGRSKGSDPLGIR